MSSRSEKVLGSGGEENRREVERGARRKEKVEEVLGTGGEELRKEVERRARNLVLPPEQEYMRARIARSLVGHSTSRRASLGASLGGRIVENIRARFN